MNILLEKLLGKRKLTITELDADEAQKFDEWNKILSEGEITVEKIKDFCEGQLKIIEGQLKNFDNTKEKNERLIIYFNVYKTLTDLIKSPQAERSSLENYLSQLLK